ncbi:4Fe-4S binding protein [Niveispirillum sp. SYP-B3756]|uniref:4Fe-4S binding protein n=1 Tax=Niveispirillum sp. SYP-B3756 TaxID=2662178 RepID=UPI001290A030|nr:4Fe-4S binding protein [Niveispirillum sp. SYP-B3756]MQP65317.1 4Fe-4S binding protein [Niveispirillum sp. SYP-B3756]
MMLLRLVLFLMLVLFAAPAPAAALTEEELARLLPDGYSLGEKEKTMPAWPLIKAGMVAGYIFETGSLTSIPGFSGTPMNLLVAMDDAGRFLDVQILSQHEPVFVDGLGPQPFADFLTQYRGLTIRQNIKIGSQYGASDRASSSSVTLDGVAKATASLRIANLTILGAATKVAQAKMAALAPKPKSIPRPEMDQIMGWDTLVASNYVRRLTLTNAMVEQAFQGTPFAGLDAAGLADPQGIFIDLWVAYLNVPTIGRSLLGEAQYAQVMDRLQPGEEVLLVLSSGRYSYTGPDFVPATVPDRLAVSQAGFPVNIRDMVHDYVLPAGLPAVDEVRLFRIDGSAAFDPASPWTLSLRTVREKGLILPDRQMRDFTLNYALPASLFTAPVMVETPPEWLLAWGSRLPELAILGLLLLGLTAGLIAQTGISRRERLFYWTRMGFLAATLGFIGIQAQGQLSIVTVQGVVKGAVNGMDFSFLLYDPVSLLLWAYVAVTAIIWGRGTFCGWLCPFGALQEFADALGRLLRLRRIRVPGWLDQRLVLVKYAMLALLLATALVLPGEAEKAAEVEPFKTAITLGFVRDLPFVLYAGFWLLLGLVMFKPFCRYLCPLGAFLALAGRLRLLDWIPRRPACGSPCQLCTSRCRYKAIRRDGSIRYDECFQCLDCVGIYADKGRCVPLVVAARHGEGAAARIQPRKGSGHHAA